MTEKDERRHKLHHKFAEIGRIIHLYRYNPNNAPTSLDDVESLVRRALFFGHNTEDVVEWAYRVSMTLVEEGLIKDRTRAHDAVGLVARAAARIRQSGYKAADRPGVPNQEEAL